MKQEIILKQIDELIPYINNPKQHPADQVDKIASSIKNYGFTVPMVIDGQNEIIMGHGRLMAAKKLGIEEVPCIVRDDLTESQVKALRIADNKVSESEWDIEILLAEIDGLEDFTGFSLDEIGTMEIDLRGENEVVEDEVPELPEEPKTKLGDLYILGRHRLLCGDSTKAEDVERLMDGKKADMVFTDPPWNVNYGAVDDGNAQGYKPRTIMNDFMGTDEFKAFMYAAFACMNRASKPGCMTYVVMSAQEWGNMMLTLAQNDYHWSSTIIWNKDHLVLSRKDYHTKYEPLWYGWSEGDARLCPLEDRKQSDVWDIDRPTVSELHPTQKPIGLVARAIENSSRRDNGVLDLFGGSGSTLIAAEQLNRICYMMELDPKYCDVIVERWENLTGQKAELVKKE